MEDADLVIRKNEKTALDRFRNQRTLLKQFGEDGIRVYVALGENKSMGQMLSESHVSEDKFIEILELMDREGIVTTTHAGPGSPAYTPPPPEPKTQPIPEKPPETRPSSTPYGGIEPIKPFDVEPKAARPYAREKEEKPYELPQAKKAEAQPPPTSREVAEPRERDEPEAIRPEAEERIMPADLDAKKVKPEDMLSPIERMIYDKFGKTGVDVYNLIDGEKTAEEILLETGINESKLVEILEFMDDQGIIKLEKPEQAGRLTAAAPEAPPSPQEEPAFEPMLEEKPEAPLPQAGTKLMPVELPSKTKPGIFGRFSVSANLAVRYPFAGRRLFAEIDGIKDTVQLSKRTRIPFAKMDKILKSLSRRNAIEIKPLIETEIKERYGDEGVSVYRRYGREGLLIYELIGKEASLRDIVLTSSVEPKKGADIIVYIHSMLGIDMPLDKKMLYQQLGVKP